MIGALQRNVRGARVGGVAAGLHLLIELPDSQAEALAIEQAEDRGLALQGLSTYAAGLDQRRRGLVVG